LEENSCDFAGTGIHPYVSAENIAPAAKILHDRYKALINGIV